MHSFRKRPYEGGQTCSISLFLGCDQSFACHPSIPSHPIHRVKKWSEVKRCGEWPKCLQIFFPPARRPRRFPSNPSTTYHATAETCMRLWTSTRRCWDLHPSRDPDPSTLMAPGEWWRRWRSHPYLHSRLLTHQNHRHPLNSSHLYVFALHMLWWGEVKWGLNCWWGNSWR